jgi:endonuclease-3
MITTIIKEYGKDPYLILIGCLLSLRSRDVKTLPVCRELFERARTPQELLKIPLDELEKILYPLGFYRRKAATIRAVSKALLEDFSGKVPATEQELLSLPGVGRKTTNLVLAEAFGIPALCVDTHVHRLSNRFGLVKTKTPIETEYALREILPQRYWAEWNRLLVMWGQNIK